MFIVTCYYCNYKTIPRNLLMLTNKYYYSKMRQYTRLGENDACMSVLL